MTTDRRTSGLALRPQRPGVVRPSTRPAVVVALYLSSWLALLIAALFVHPSLALVLAVAGSVVLMGLVTVVYTQYRPVAAPTETTIAVSFGLHHRRHSNPDQTGQGVAAELQPGALDRQALEWSVRPMLDRGES